MRKASDEDKGVSLCRTETKEGEGSGKGVEAGKKRRQKARSEQRGGVQLEDLSHPFLNRVIALPQSQHCVNITILHHHQMPFETVLDA